MAGTEHVPHWEYQVSMPKSGKGTAAMGAEASGPNPFAVQSLKQVTPGKPGLTDEALGWLAYLDRRVGFGGTWGKGDAPHESWDNLSDPPLGNYYKYDLSWQSYALGIMADQTPAWREVYSRILDFSAQRFLEYWTLFDWVERRGADPDRDNYPDWWYAVVIPPGYKGKYDAPGWASNGIEPYEYDPDPVRANGSCNVMYKGYLDFVLGYYAYVSGDDKYDHPFKVVYDDTLVFEYDYVRLNELIAEQFYNTWSGLSCEVTKAYAACNTITGLSLKLFDLTHGTTHVDAFHNWKRYFRQNYMGNGMTDDPVDRLTLFYDVTIDANLHGEEHQIAYNWGITSWNGLPLDRRLYERLYQGAMNRFFTPKADGSAHLVGMPGMEIDSVFATVSAMAVAKELGDNERYAAMRSWAQKVYEPTWDTERGEFYFRFGYGASEVGDGSLAEAWPRAQHNHFILPSFMITEPGQFTKMYTEPNLSKFREPTVEGVDFPTVRPRQAYWDKAEKTLFVSITSCARDRLGDPTSFRVTNLHPTATYRLTIDGEEMGDLQPVGSALQVETRVGAHNIQLRQR